ncbi:MAG: ABC transporter ATP-binding protein [Gemmatimonadota bacterium]|nr:MAG: ABC transporter ATP-binding protein [Gemmatimonadota bacterium]
MVDLSDLFKIPIQQTNAKFSLLFRALAFTWQTGKFFTILILIVNIISALFPAANLFIVKNVIDSIVNLLNTQRSGGLKDLSLWIALLIGIWVIQHIISTLQTSASSWLDLRVKQNAQISIMRKCSEFDIAFFENPTNLNMVQNAYVGATGDIFYVMILFFSVIETIVTLISFIAILFGLHWVSVMIIIATTLPQIFSNRYFAKRRWEITTGLVEPRRMSSYYSSVVTRRGVAKEIRLFGLFKHFLDRFISFTGQFRQIEKTFLKKQAVINFLVNLITIAGSSLIWLYILHRAIGGTISIGDIVFYTGAVSSFQGGLSTVFSYAGQVFQHVLFLGNFFSFLDLDPFKVEGALKGPANVIGNRSGHVKPPVILRKGIEFKNVSFKYPQTDKLVLNNISLFLPPKESVALVGENGAGKTTLIKLLVRLYDPTEGQILIDDRDIRDYDLESLHRIFAEIFQDYICYPLTVRENIGYGNIERIDDISSIQRASQLAGVHEFIERFPDKYETYLGRLFQKSNIDLSVGQWQKIGLARALMREDAPVLILDEPTAALDVYAEYEMYRQFSAMMANRLTIIISHRFSTVRAAHHILVLHEGCLVEQGSHEKLMNQDTLYKEMYTIQADRFK